MKFHQRAGATLLAVGLLVPAGAAVATSANAATPIAAHQGHGKAKVTCYKSAKADFRKARTAFKQANRAAIVAKKKAYRAAKKTWLAATVKERAVRRAALAAATTDEQRKAARTAFRAETVDERAVRQDAKKAARKQFRMDKQTARTDFKDARKEFRMDKRACRK